MNVFCSSDVLWLILVQTGAVYLSHGSYGILYIQYNGVYGTVCDDAFDQNNNGCTVVCRQLGYTSVMTLLYFIHPQSVCAIILLTYSSARHLVFCDLEF